MAKKQIKTLPKAQRTQGLSSYHTNIDQISSSESPTGINFEMSTKHEHLD